MKKITVLGVLILLICIGLSTIADADEWGWSDSDGFYYRDSPSDQIMKFLPMIIVIIVIIVIAVIGIAAVGSMASKSKNNNQSFIPPTPPSNPSQYAFIKKSYCSECGRMINYEYNMCPYCGHTK